MVLEKKYLISYRSRYSWYRPPLVISDIYKVKEVYWPLWYLRSWTVRNGVRSKTTLNIDFSFFFLPHLIFTFFQSFIAIFLLNFYVRRLCTLFKGKREGEEKIERKNKIERKARRMWFEDDLFGAFLVSFFFIFLRLIHFYFHPKSFHVIVNKAITQK